MGNPNTKPTLATGIVDSTPADPSESKPLVGTERERTTVDAVNSGAKSRPKKLTTEYVILIRHPQNRTLHALLHPKAGPGVLAVFESPEDALVQVSTVPALQNKECFILGIE